LPVDTLGSKEDDLARGSIELVQALEGAAFTVSHQ
jgi:hypothetical protein